MLLLLCLVIGLIWGVLFVAGMNLAGIPMDWTDAVWGGLLFAALMFIVLAPMGRMQRRRVEKAAGKLPSPATHSFVVLLLEGKHVLGRAAYLCEDCLCLADISAKALPITTYPADEIIRAAQPSPDRLEIHLTEGRVITLRTNEAEIILDVLKDRGWLPFQH